MSGDNRQPTAEPQRGRYTVTTQPTEKANEFQVTLRQGGRVVKAMTVVATSPRSAYFNDERTRSGK